MRLGMSGAKKYFITLFILIVANVFFTGFHAADSTLNISRFVFYLLISLVVFLHIIIGRADLIFITGCVATLALKFFGVPEIISDSLMVLVLAWGLSYLRYDLRTTHFTLIFIYGCVSIVVAGLQLAGVEQLHMWNTLMTNSQGIVDSSLSRPMWSTPMWGIDQSQIRPPGLFHSNAIFALFVCYFYGVLLQKSLRFLPLGLIAVWICGSKIVLLFAVLFPLIMIFQQDSLPRRFFLRVYFPILVFFPVMAIIFPELTERKYSIDSFLFSSLLRLRNLDQILNIGFDFSAVSAFDGLNDSRVRDDTILSGIFGFIAFFVAFFFLGIRRFWSIFTRHSAEFSAFFFVALATPVTGNLFFMLILYPVFYSLRAKKRHAVIVAN